MSMIQVPARLPKWNGLYYGRRSGMGDLLDPNSPVDILPGGAEIGVDPSAGITTPGFVLPTLSTPVTTPVPTIAQPASSSNLWSQLLTGGLDIAKMATAQNTPAGQALVYNSKGQLVSASTEPAGVPLGTTAASATVAGMSPTTLVLIAAAALAFFAMSRR